MSGTHAPTWYGDDRTLCDMAYDAFESGDADEPVVVAKPGERVECPSCRTCIDYCRTTFTPRYVFLNKQANKS